MEKAKNHLKEFWNTQRNIQDPVFREFKKYQRELESKNELVMNLSSLNDELVDRNKKF